MPEYPINPCCMRTADECDCELRRRTADDLLSRVATQKRLALTRAAGNIEQAFTQLIETVHRDCVEIERLLTTPGVVSSNRSVVLAIARCHILKLPVDPLVEWLDKEHGCYDATGFATALREAGFIKDDFMTKGAG